MARLLIEERYTWPVRTVPLGGGSLRATSYQICTTHIWSAPLCKRKIKFFMKEKLQPYIRYLDGINLSRTLMEYARFCPNQLIGLSVLSSPLAKAGFQKRGLTFHAIT